MVLLKSLLDRENMIEKLGVGVDISCISDFKKISFENKRGFL